MLAEKGIKPVKVVSASIMKRDYIMEPDPLPYQDILDTTTEPPANSNPNDGTPVEPEATAKKPTVNPNKAPVKLEAPTMELAVEPNSPCKAPIKAKSSKEKPIAQTQHNSEKTYAGNCPWCNKKLYDEDSCDDCNDPQDHGTATEQPGGNNVPYKATATPHEKTHNPLKNAPPPKQSSKLIKERKIKRDNQQQKPKNIPMVKEKEITNHTTNKTNPSQLYTASEVESLGYNKQTAQSTETIKQNPEKNPRASDQQQKTNISIQAKSPTITTNADNLEPSAKKQITSTTNATISKPILKKQKSKPFLKKQIPSKIKSDSKINTSVAEKNQSANITDLSQKKEVPRKSSQSFKFTLGEITNGKISPINETKSEKVTNLRSKNKSTTPKLQQVIQLLAILLILAPCDKI